MANTSFQRLTGLLNFGQSLNDSVDYDGYDEDWGEHSGARTISSLVYAMLFCVGMPGNAIVLLLVLFWMNLRNTSNILVLNLAFADLLNVAWIPVIILKYQLGYWQWGEIPCRLFFAANIVNQFAGVLFLTALSIDRYFAICKPLSSLSLRTPRNTVLGAICCWVIVIIVATPAIVYSGTVGDERIFGSLENETMSYFFQTLNVTRNQPSTQCIVQFTSIDVLGVSYVATGYIIFCCGLAYVLPMSLMWTLYILTSAKLAKHEHKMSNHSSLRNSRGPKKNAAYTVICLVSFYTICWTPYWLLQVMINYCHLRGHMQDLQNLITVLGYVSYGFAYLNAAVDPYIFLTVSSEVNSAMNSLPRFARRRNVNYTVMMPRSLNKRRRKRSSGTCQLDTPCNSAKGRLSLSSLYLSLMQGLQSNDGKATELEKPGTQTTAL